MTGYTVHTGSNEQFSGGWDRVFGSKSPAATTQPKPPAAVKKAVKKTAPASPKKRAK